MKMSFKELKKHAKTRLKKNYIIFALACMLATFLGSAYISTFSGLTLRNNELVANEIAENKENSDEGTSISLNAGDVLADLLEHKLSEAKKTATAIEEKDAKTDTTIGVISVQYSRGVFAKIVNGINSGSLFVTIYTAVSSIIASKNLVKAIFIAIVALLGLLSQYFLRNLYKVAFRRIFMEGETYDEVSAKRFLFLHHTHKTIRATLSAFVVSFYKLLWNLTIVGGFVKRYSYYMVPYILAENPSLNSWQVLKLSERMMKGHKFELFRLEMSFIGWWLLGNITFGLSEMVFSNPYEECCYTYYYSLRRQEMLEKRLEGYELLNDRYLFAYADEKTLKEAYQDIFEIQKENIDLERFSHSGIRGFFEKNFGLVLYHDAEERLYAIQSQKADKLNDFQYIIAKSQYPSRLNPIEEHLKEKDSADANCYRHYALTSIVIMFITFSFVGWLWEVSLHFVQTGEFVNRGVLHGPWLPIYGSGAVLILLLLYRLRNRPWIYVLATTVLCGAVEYFTSWYLELTKGVRWWDYSGYFLNINGRICAEGLLVFAVAGVAVTYMLAPVFDDYISKANPKVIMPLTALLLVIFGSDLIYSAKNPNMGTGVTDCDDETSAFKEDGNNLL